MVYHFRGDRVTVKLPRLLNLLAACERQRSSYEYFLYVLKRTGAEEMKTEGSGSRSYYAGMTNDLLGRMNEHSGGQVRSTRCFTWELVAAVPIGNRQAAALVEAWMKTGKSRDKRVRLEQMFTEPVQLDEIGGYLYSLALAWQIRREARQGVHYILPSMTLPTSKKAIQANV